MDHETVWSFFGDFLSFNCSWNRYFIDLHVNIINLQWMWCNTWPRWCEILWNDCVSHAEKCVSQFGAMTPTLQPHMRVPKRPLLLIRIQHAPKNDKNWILVRSKNIENEKCELNWLLSALIETHYDVSKQFLQMTFKCRMDKRNWSENKNECELR